MSVFVAGAISAIFFLFWNPHLQFIIAPSEKKRDPQKFHMAPAILRVPYVSNGFYFKLRVLLKISAAGLYYIKNVMMFVGTNNLDLKATSK